MVALRVFLFSLVFSLIAIRIEANSEIFIKEGIYVPFFQDKNEGDQKIGRLIIDKFPVTNDDFLRFIKSHPEWRRSLRKEIFAGPSYLEHWDSDTTFPIEKTFLPVTNISWFVARKYCEAQHKRLLTTAEWEYASDAQNPTSLDLILSWYGKTDDQLASVKIGQKNSYGLVGMHGIVWEWVEDFSSAIMAGDGRSSNETSGSLFCGSGSLKAKDPSQYATFMRFAYRSSLKANSVGRNLGFRCGRSTQ